MMPWLSSLSLLHSLSVPEEQDKAVFKDATYSPAGQKASGSERSALFWAGNAGPAWKCHPGWDQDPWVAARAREPGSNGQPQLPPWRFQSPGPAGQQLTAGWHQAQNPAVGQSSSEPPWEGGH